MPNNLIIISINRSGVANVSFPDISGEAEEFYQLIKPAIQKFNEQIKEVAREDTIRIAQRSEKLS